MQFLPPPGPERRRQFVLLGVLVVGLTAYAWYQGWYPFGSPTTATPAATSKEQSRTQQGKDAAVLPDPVKLAALDSAPEDYPSTRNPFRYYVKPLPPPPPVQPQPAYVPPPLPEVPQPPPGPPPIPLKYQGSQMLVDTKKWRVFLIDESGLTLFADEGDVIYGKYRVVKVNPNSVVLEYKDGTGRVTKTSNGGDE